MKRIKRTDILIFALLAVFSFAVFLVIRADAHNIVLDVEYDDCVPVPTGDGIDEIWYVLNEGVECWHLGHTVPTIYYYFEDEYTYKDNNGKDQVYTWTTTVGAPAEEIKMRMQIV